MYTYREYNLFHVNTPHRYTPLIQASDYLKELHRAQKTDDDHCSIGDQHITMERYCDAADRATITAALPVTTITTTTTATPPLTTTDVKTSSRRVQKKAVVAAIHKLPRLFKIKTDHDDEDGRLITNSATKE